MQVWWKEVREQLGDPDFWKLFGLFLLLFIGAVLFLFLAARFDFLARISGSFGRACRKLNDWQALFLFVSPFAIGMASLVATGELISQLEIKKRRKKPMRWGTVLRAFGVAVGLFALAGVLMVIWC